MEGRNLKSLLDLGKEEKDKINERVEVFDGSEELEKIKKMNLPEKEEAIDKFKEKLKNQLRGIAFVQESMLEAIKQNPDMTKQEFNTILSSKSATYGFNDEIIEKAKTYFNNYQERHEKLEEFKKKNLGANKIFEALFTEKPTGKVTVSSDPISLQIGCSSAKDFVWVSEHATGKGPKNPKEASVLKSLGKSIGFAGFALGKSHLPEDAPHAQVVNKNILFRKGVVGHEAQHVWYDAVFSGKETEDQYWYEMYKKRRAQKVILSYVELESLSEFYLQELEENFSEYLQGLLGFGCEAVKNEMLAMIKGGSSNIEISLALNNSVTRESSYDFLKQIRNPSKDDPLYFWKKLKSQQSEHEYKNIEDEHVDNMQEIRDHDILISETIDRVKKQTKETLEIYKKTVAGAIKAIGKIKSKSFNKDQLIALLTATPLQDFSKIAERI